MKGTAKWFEALVGLIKEIWNKYEIQAVVLTSLAIQLLLVLLAPLRKRSKNGFILSIMWLCYLLADYCATFGIGLISRESPTGSSQIAAFWAPFLLLHLGAPHNITALAMEDNGLWVRHLLTLIFQVPLILFVFYRHQIYKTDLLIPAASILAAGIFKYAERVSSLYLASLPSIRRGIQVPLDLISQLDYRFEFEEASDPNKHDEINIVQRGYLYYQSFIRFVIDHTFSQLEEDVAKKFFSSLGYEDAFKVMEVELNFMYDAMFTKMASVRQIRFSTVCTYIYPFLSHALVVTVAVKFFISPNCKHNVDPRDISITYALLGGAIVLDFIAFVNVLFSEWTIALLKNKVLQLVLHWDKERWIWSSITSRRTVNTINFAKRRISSSKRWSKEMRQYNLVIHSLRRRFKCTDRILKCLGVKETIDSWLYTTTKPVESYLMKLVFECVKKKATEYEDAGESRSSRPLNRIIIPKLGRFQNQYEKCVFVLHIATEICYLSIPSEKEDKNLVRICRSISEYLAYLVYMEGLITTTVPGMRFRDIFPAEEIIAVNKGLLLSILYRFYKSYLPSMTLILDDFGDFLKQRKRNAAAGTRLDDFRRGRDSFDMLDQFRDICSSMIESNLEDDADHAWMLHEAITLARDLKYYIQNPAGMQPNDDNYCSTKQVWEDLSQVWIELLLYTASHCRGDVQYLSRGGEFITFVRLLMAHFGLREWFKDEGGFQLHALIH